MFVHANVAGRGRRLSSLAALAAFAAVAATTVVAQPAGGIVSASAKPVIGKPTAVPAQPVAGKRFTVAFKVTRGVGGGPLMRGTMVCDPSVAGRVIAHAESFKSGVARLAFVVPTGAAGNVLKVKVTIRAGTGSATRVSRFQVLGSATPSISVAGVTLAEGDGSGSASMSFPVRLSTPASQPVSVSYATSDGTATAPADYAATSGTLVFTRGQAAKVVTVAVVGDELVEPDETFTMALSSPVNATIATGRATGTIANDDTAVAVTPGSYSGQTQEGNYVFFTVTPNRTITNLRINALPCMCEPGARLDGAPDFGDAEIPLGADAAFSADDSWTGSDVVGDIEWTYEYVKITGRFGSPTTVNGTILLTFELKYEGTHYRCSSGEVQWTAALQS